MTTSVREPGNSRQFLDLVRNQIECVQALIITTLPRGDLQVAQPLMAGDELVRVYARGFHADDRLTWQCIQQLAPLRAADCWSPEEFAATPYYQEWMKPAGLAHLAAAPLMSPVLNGYPGAIHLCRAAARASFTKLELKTLQRLATAFGEQIQAARTARTGPDCSEFIQLIDRPQVKFAVIDDESRSVLPDRTWTSMDERLRERMVRHAQHRLTRLNGDTVQADRVLLPDSHGDNWPYRVVTYKRYPALGEGSYSFFCLQPDCSEWGVLRPTDLQADQELARLLPAIRFMQEHFAEGVTLVAIAKTVGLSPFHFHRRFTELFGMTPKQFLLECQINQAKRDLLARDKELVQIAAECGFAHQSHFTSRFKQATGLTPTQWRRVAMQRGTSLTN